MSLSSETASHSSLPPGSPQYVPREELADIVARARSLSDRLAQPAPKEPPPDDASAERLLGRWRHLVAEGDEAVFRKRLDWDGIDPELVRALLGSPEPSDVEGWPTWAEVVQDVIDASSRLETQAKEDGLVDDRCFLPDFAEPFQDVVLPFVVVARERLAERVGPAGALVSPDAMAILEHRLLQRVAQLGSSALMLEFATRRQRRQSSLSRLVATLQGEPGTDQYVAFSLSMWTGGLVELFRAYPVLARLCATVTELWVDATTEFVLRLAADRARIEQTFHPGTELGPVVAVGYALSDSHNGGRTVIAATFGSGTQLIYKPKDVHLEQAYFALLRWLDERGAPLPFAQLRVVDGAGYGWSEFAETLPCTDKEAAQRYYRRAGMLLGLLYGLAGNDCHYDNLVAHGEHPVLVDMETFLQPEPQPFEDDAAAEMLGARSVATELFRASVLATGLLPRWMVNKEGRVHDPSALGVGAQESFDPVPRWLHINTDAMTVKHEFVMFDSTQNVPVLAGEPLPPNDFVEEIVDGLSSMYRLLLEHRDAMLAVDGPLAAFALQPVRYLTRDTRTYYMVLERATQREFLRDGAVFSIELDVLSRALLTTAQPSLLWPSRRDEQAAMERLDIPAFTTRADSTSLPLTGGVTVERAFARSGYDLAAERLRSLSEEDLDRQVAFTRASLYSRTASSLGETLASAMAPEGASVANAPMSRDELVASALAVASELEEHAIRSPDGGTSWIGVSYLPQADRYQLEPTGFDLYSGNPGIALFLAALTKVTGSSEIRDRARSAMLPVTRMLQAHPVGLVKSIGIGGAAGTGSLVYALLRSGELLGDDDLITDAERAAALITPELIAADKGLDIVTGSAGALLGLLALHAATGRPDLLDRAVLCGRRLVATQLTDGDERGSWPTLSQTGMTGFSHGAAGIAYALLRLGAVTDDPQVRRAAEAAIAYERRVFSPEEGNWPDKRKAALALTGGEPSFLTQWCHGAAGIGLARLAGLGALDTPEMREEIDVAVAATQRFGVQSVDYVCCGSMGRAEFLLSVGRGLDRPALVDESGRFAATVVQRAAESDGYKVLGRLPNGVGRPSFFQGTGGIGYQLLRHAYPEVLPSVLVWE